MGYQMQVLRQQDTQDNYLKQTTIGPHILDQKEVSSSHRDYHL